MEKPSPIAPPRELPWGTENFEYVGREFLKYFTDIAKLRPEERVLDIGCGIGRMAVPLTQYLNEQGSYEGFDIRPEGILWCQENITSKFPQFRFQWVDLYSPHYYPKGRGSSAAHSFPYEDNFFDVAVLISVFTHMQQREMENYISQTARTLKKGGRCLATYFLLNQESKETLAAKKTKMDFRYPAGENALTVNDASPEIAMAYREEFVRGKFEQCGFEVQGIWPGSWCRKENFLSYQDLLLAVKK